MPEIDAHSWKNKPLVLLEFRWPSGAKAPRGGWLVSCKNGAVLRVSIGLYGCHVGRSVVAVDLASRFDKWESMLLDRVYPVFCHHGHSIHVPIVPALGWPMAEAGWCPVAGLFCLLCYLGPLLCWRFAGLPFTSPPMCASGLCLRISCL